jgi:transcriptional regulator with XRE-family HTH domain
MAVHAGAIEAMERARTHLPEVVRTYMRVLGISQEELGQAIGMTQRQVSRRLTVPGSLSGEDIAALAAYFGVEIASLFKPIPEAVTDLLHSDRTGKEASLDPLISGKGWNRLYAGRGRAA